MNAFVSIIIPTYNRAHLICETLDSIFAQTYTNWQCIVVDDGSTDDTDIVLAKYCTKDSRFQYYPRPKNRPKGANACRNYGFELSKGEFVNWFDSDDIMMPNKLELQVNELEQNPDAPYCICQSLWYDKENKKSLGLRAKSISSNNRFEDYVLYKIFWLTTAPIWRKSFILANNLKFDETLSQSQEYDFHIRALAISDDYLIINEPLVKIMRHKEAISHNIFSDEQKVWSNLKVKSMIFKNYANHISNQGKLKLNEMLTIMFKELLALKNFKQAFKLMWQLIDTLKYINISFLRKLIFSIKLMLIFMSYRIFGRGYNLMRPLK